jgi:hypothetical protein
MVFDQPDLCVADLIDASTVITDIRVETAGGGS